MVSLPYGLLRVTIFPNPLLLVYLLCVVRVDLGRGICSDGCFYRNLVPGVSLLTILRGIFWGFLARMLFRLAAEL